MLCYDFTKISGIYCFKNHKYHLRIRPFNGNYNNSGGDRLPIVAEYTMGPCRQPSSSTVCAAHVYSGLIQIKIKITIETFKGGIISSQFVRKSAS